MQVVAHRKVAEAVFCALPSSYDPMVLPYTEALSLGKKLLPEWMLIMVQNPGCGVQLDVICTMMARGFLISAIFALPEWLRSAWVVKSEDLESRGKDAVIDDIAGLIVGVDDAEKLARQWVMLASGYTEEEAILNDIEEIANNSFVLPERDPMLSRIAALEEL